MKNIKLNTLFDRLKRKSPKNQAETNKNSKSNSDKVSKKSQILERLNKVGAQDKAPTEIHKVSLKENIQDYYKQARGWQYDVFDSVVLSRDRYRKAFNYIAIFCVLLLVIMAAMLPMRKIVPILAHEDANGQYYVTMADKNYNFEHTPAQIKSELYHYVKNFEGYSITSFNLASSYVKAQSSKQVFDQYAGHVSTSNLLEKLGKKGFRQVNVDYIQLVNSKHNQGQLHAQNQAIVTFEIIDKYYTGQVIDSKKWQAIINWEYKGLPSTPEEQFINFDGFTVTGYQSAPLSYHGQSNV